MTWQSYLRTRTRQPEFLWRLVIWVLAAGIGSGYVADKFWRPSLAPRDPAKFAERLESLAELDRMAERGEWGELWWALPAQTYRYERLGPVMLAALAGSSWLIFLWQAMQMPKLRSLAFWCMLAAIPLGILSIWPTLFFDYWLEHRWSVVESSELIPGLRFFILSVGAREELAKLLCLLPLMPLLLSIRSELTALMVSGCVGLGFAMEENINYFARSGGDDSLGRFLTANPLHITLTGLAGLMLYRVCRNPQGWAAHALGVFGLLIFAHGLYDAFIVLPALSKDYGLFGTIIFALVVYQFFRELRDLRTKSGETISLSATFLCGVSVMLAATFVYLSGTIGLSSAFDSLVSSILSLAVMAYLFLREMPETMVRV